MKLTWNPHGPLKGKFVFLSASVPHPERNPRYLKGPVEERLMLRVMDQRIDDAVQSLVVQTLQAGGRIVHGGQPKIFWSLTRQAGRWQMETEADPPIRIYQSELFRNLAAPPGRDELERSGIAKTIWVPADLGKAIEKLDMGSQSGWIAPLVSEQAGSNAPQNLKEALLALRLQMLLESRPSSAICIGGMEGIEAEAKLYLKLAQLKFIPGEPHVTVLRSTYGAAANLSGEAICFAEDFARHTTENQVTWAHNLMGPMNVVSSDPTQRTLGPAEADLDPTSETTAKKDITRRVSYEATMQNFIRKVAAH